VRALRHQCRRLPTQQLGNEAKALGVLRRAADPCKLLKFLCTRTKASRGQATEAVLVSRILSNYYWPRESILVCSR
jgi:hypothetical protein